MSFFYEQIERLIKPIFYSCLILGFFSIAEAGIVSDEVRKKIEYKFPGAEIKEVRDDTWKGKPVTEVEIVTKEGETYEFVLSKDEKILNIEEEKELPLIGGELSLGAAVFAERDVYKGMDTEVQPVPFIRYENGPLEIQTQDGLNVSYSIFRGESFSFAILGEYSFEEGYDSDDSIYLKGMDELSSTYSIGLEWEMMLGNFESSIEALHDLSSEESGQEVEFSLVYPWMFAGFEFRPGLNVTWLSKRRVDYLYGVSAREATLDRPVYEPGSCFEIGAELMIQKPFLDKFTFVALIEARKLGSEISDSPIVDDDIEISGALGVMYSF